MPLTFTESPIDRAEHLRAKDAEVRALTTSARAQFLPVWKDLHPVGPEMRPLSFGPEILTKLAGDAVTVIFLGLAEDAPRFALALSVALAGASPCGTLMFDEADMGVGGAVAAAVGERLARLAQDRQVLAITHSPQVAAAATRQLRVSKAEADGRYRIDNIPPGTYTVAAWHEGDTRETKTVTIPPQGGDVDLDFTIR